MKSNPDMKREASGWRMVLNVSRAKQFHLPHIDSFNWASTMFASRYRIPLISAVVKPTRAVMWGVGWLVDESTSQSVEWNFTSSSFSNLPLPASDLFIIFVKPQSFDAKSHAKTSSFADLIESLEISELMRKLSHLDTRRNSRGKLISRLWGNLPSASWATCRYSSLSTKSIFRSRI